MSEYEFLKLKAQREILQHIIKDFGDNRSLGNVLQNLNAQIKGEEKRRAHDTKVENKQA